MKKPEPGANGWYEIVGKSARVDLWVWPEWEGPDTLRDGRDFCQEIGWGRGDQLGAPWWYRQQEPCRATRLADILWSGGASPFTVVSERFVEVIGELGVTGWSTYPITIVDRRDNPIDGYVGFIPPLRQPQELLTTGWKRHRPADRFFVTERVLDGLLAEGVDLFDVWPAEKKYAPPSFKDDHGGGAS